MNVDLKSFSSEFYRKLCGGGIDPVKRTIEVSSGKCHVEITCLIIPDLNDSPQEIEAMAMWIATLSPEIPLHLSRFFPDISSLIRSRRLYLHWRFSPKLPLNTSNMFISEMFRQNTEETSSCVYPCVYFSIILHSLINLSNVY